MLKIKCRRFFSGHRRPPVEAGCCRSYVPVICTGKPVSKSHFSPKLLTLTGAATTEIPLYYPDTNLS